MNATICARFTARLLFTLASGGCSLASQAAVLDDFTNTGAWQAVHSEDVQASVEFPNASRPSLRLNYDFGKVSGYAVATRTLPIAFPENFELTLKIRGVGLTNEFQLKFADASGDNVWWYPLRNFKPTAEGQVLRIKKRHIDFAWGPTSDKALRSTVRVELSVNAASGGSGYLEFEQFTLTPLPPADYGSFSLVATASTEAKHSPAGYAVDGRMDTSWVSNGKRSQSIELDFGKVREFGGLELKWQPGHHASRYEVQLSDNDNDWRTVKTVAESNGNNDPLFLPESEARRIRLLLQDGPGATFAIEDVRILDVAAGSSLNAFYRVIAKAAPPGAYPRGFSGQQTYWTVVGTDRGVNESLMGEDGAIEARAGSVAIEPFVMIDGRVQSWSDVKTSHSLESGYVPIPTVRWEHPAFDLSITAAAIGDAEESQTLVRYVVTNKSNHSKSLTLALAVRPFQVNPPSQFLGTPGGVTRVESLEWDGQFLIVNGVRILRTLSAGAQFGGGAFDVGNPVEWLQTNSIPQSHRIADVNGLASGVFRFELPLAAGASGTVSVALPLDGIPAGINEHDVDAAIASTRTRWTEKLDRVRFDVPAEAQALIDTLRTAHSHILINSDGPSLQPGSRAYSRAWIRDGAMEADTLLRLGDIEPAKEFLRWYAPRLFDNGKVPCCVDHRGSDPVPENDSSGEFIFLVADIYRYTRDLELLKQMWPSVQKAMTYLESLRLTERTEAILNSPQRAFYGMVPASISHEGYSAKPMHSYWDNFWTMKGLDAAVEVAAAIGDPAKTREYRRSRDEFRADLQASLSQAMKDQSIHFLPGSAELGDFDATSTSIGLSPAGDRRLFPQSSLEVTFERYWATFIARDRAKVWVDYTPYELRNVATFAHLGWRARIATLLDFFMTDRRPARWNQWAEVVGRIEREERFIGDMPHSWVGSDYIRSVLDLFAYERSEDKSIVLMAGIQESWLRKGIGIERLRTPYGALSYEVRPTATGFRVNIGGIDLPPGGLVMDWSGLPVKRTRMQGGQARWEGEQLRITKLPASFEVSR
jgi:hypothetical protein